MGDFLAFRRMLTPVLIQILFWLGMIVVVIAGSSLFIFGDGAERVGGLAIFIFGSLHVRVFSELFIVIFRINETLTDIRRNTQPLSAGRVNRGENPPVG